jgi:hypothetical protein
VQCSCRERDSEEPARRATFGHRHRQSKKTTDARSVTSEWIECAARPVVRSPFYGREWTVDYFHVATNCRRFFRAPPSDSYPAAGVRLSLSPSQPPPSSSRVGMQKGSLRHNYVLSESSLIPDFWTSVRGQPVATYRWTGWIWEITCWSSSRLQENLWILVEEFIEYRTPQRNEEKTQKMSPCNQCMTRKSGKQQLCLRLWFLL